MAKQVEHPRACAEPRDPIAVQSLIEEEPGLLASEQVNREMHATLLNNRGSIVPMQQCHRFRQPLQPARSAIAAGHDSAPGHERQQHLDDGGQQPFHPGSVGLDYRHLAVAVDHQTRQPVGFRVYQPMERTVRYPGAQVLRIRKPRAQPSHVDHSFRIGVQDTCRNQAARIEHGGAETDTVITLDAHQYARRKRTIFRPHRNLVAEHPRRPRPQAPSPSRIEPQQ